MKLSQKAAMFGLDARIALAIFGALSVISGAALYSAIQDSRVTALITEMNELGKAVDSYHLDTGVLPAFDTTRTHFMDAMKLVSDSTAGWKGPYFSGKQYGSTNGDVFNLAHNNYDYIGIRRMETSSWGDASSSPCTSNANPCALYIVAANIPKGFADKVDEKIDTSKDDSNGRVRLLDVGSSNVAIFMEYRPYTYQ